ncbi:MAG TPA: glycosyltransferase family 1 protein, partial [Mycobacteriales bacterium]|nr:glycosyltransferase family 1 protein [Mycobacteriales bacterium]
MRVLHVVVPAGIDDPTRPSGGNVYDRRVCNGLVELGWDVHELPVEGPWPCADPDALEQLRETLASVPDDAVMLIDGLVASASADILVPAGRRLRPVILVHLPLHLRGEDAVLATARAVVTTSAWARTQLLDAYALDATAVHVIAPGTDCADPTDGTSGGEKLLCVAPVSRHKGQDVL